MLTRIPFYYYHIPAAVHLFLEELRRLYPEAELYLVGGCVRDGVMHVEPHDFDLCTNLEPWQVKEAFGPKWGRLHDEVSVVDTGLKHGTVTVVYRGESYEVTTYRTDGKYTDGRHPDQVVFTKSLEEDLKRRDFTINSLAYDFERMEIIALDPSYLTDITVGIIKTVGDPNERFAEDALRMLRCIRFAARFGFCIDEEAFEAIKANADKLELISRERIRDEICKILVSRHPEYLELIIDTGMERHLFEGGWSPFGEMRRCGQGTKWHYTDVLHHTMDVVKGVPASNVCLRIAALLHDIGKPGTQLIDDEGRVTFKMHPKYSAELAERWMRILKFPNDSIQLVCAFIVDHDFDLETSRVSSIKNLIERIGKPNFRDYLALRFADAFAHKLESGTGHLIKGVSRACSIYEKVLTEKEPLSVKDLTVNGYDLMAIGFVGKEIGDELGKLLGEVLDDPLKNEKEILAEIAKKDIIVLRKGK